jgi:hypothetical protein
MGSQEVVWRKKKEERKRKEKRGLISGCLMDLIIGFI